MQISPDFLGNPILNNFRIVIFQQHLITSQSDSIQVVTVSDQSSGCMPWVYWDQRFNSDLCIVCNIWVQKRHRIIWHDNFQGPWHWGVGFFRTHKDCILFYRYKNIHLFRIKLEFGKMKKIFNIFSDRTSIHGMRFLASARTMKTKLFWSAVCMGSMGMFVFMLSRLIITYASFPVLVKVEEVKLLLWFSFLTINPFSGVPQRPVFIDRKAGDIIRLVASVCLSVHLFVISYLNHLTYDLDFWHGGRSWPWLGWGCRSRS